MQSIIAPEERPAAPETRGWAPLAGSALVHLFLMLWLVFRPVPAGTTEPKSDATEAAQPIALPPPAESQAAQPPSTQSQQRPQPQPPPKETPLGPDSKHPDALVPKEAGPTKPMTEPEPLPQKAPENAAPPAEKTPDPTPAPDLTPPTQAAKRIPRAGDLAANSLPRPQPTSPWGPTSPRPLDPTKGEGVSAAAKAPATREGAMGRVGLAGRDSRDWRPSFPEAEGRCTPIPDLGTNADGTPVLATVIGRVLDTDGHSPLVGAHLQIIGTPFSTFSDGTGEYRLEFDPKLLEQCRIQYVRVAADGYSGQMLTLMIGQRIRSDDVVLRKH